MCLLLCSWLLSLILQEYSPRTTNWQLVLILRWRPYHGMNTLRSICSYGEFVFVRTTVRVRIFARCKISWFLQFVLHLWNLILGYICPRDLKYTCVIIYGISCMSSGDDGDVDHILQLQETGVWRISCGNGVTPINNTGSAEPAGRHTGQLLWTVLVARQSCYPAKAGARELRRGVWCVIHALLVKWKTLASSACTRKN